MSDRQKHRNNINQTGSSLSNTSKVEDNPQDPAEEQLLSHNKQQNQARAKQKQRQQRAQK